MIKYKRLCLLELDQVDNNSDVMIASDECQNTHIITGDANWGYYYDLSDESIKKLKSLGADIENFYNVEIHEFLNKDDFELFFNNNSKVIDTQTVLASGYPKKDYYSVLIQGEK